MLENKRCNQLGQKLTMAALLNKDVVRFNSSLGSAGKCGQMQIGQAAVLLSWKLSPNLKVPPTSFSTDCCAKPFLNLWASTRILAVMDFGVRSRILGCAAASNVRIQLYCGASETRDGVPTRPTMDPHARHCPSTNFGTPKGFSPLHEQNDYKGYP